MMIKGGLDSIFHVKVQQHHVIKNPFSIYNTH